MKQILILDDGEIIVKDTLLIDMMWRIYCDTREKIDEAENRVDAEGALYCYEIIEKKVVKVFRAHGIEWQERLPEFCELINGKFPLDDTISDDDVPF